MERRPKSHKDNIYLNCVINPDPYLNQKDSPCKYNETLTQAIIGDPSKYYLAVARFTMPLSSIPLLLFPLDVNQTNPLLSYLIIGINLGGTYPAPSTTPTPVGGTNFPRNILYKPQSNLVEPRATGPFNNNDEINQFYWIYSIDKFIDMFNTALALAYTDAGIVGPPIPYYTYDPNTQLISLHVTDAFLLYAGSPKIFINRYMVNYLASFNFYFDSIPILGTTQLYFYHNLTVLPPGMVTPYTISEEYNAMSSWFDLRKIIVTTNSLPITPEVVPAKGSGSVTYLPIITDFTIDLANTVNLGDVAIYNPAFYRLVDMTGNVPITYINIEFYFEDRFGNIIPIPLEPYQSASIKLGFFKKSLFNDDPHAW